MMIEMAYMLIDSLKIHRWQAFKESISKGRKAACGITITTHLIESKVVISGTDYQAIKKELFSVMDAIRSSHEICESKKVIKSTLAKAKVTKIPPPTSTKNSDIPQHPLVHHH